MEDQVVTGNLNEIGYECVQWINLANDETEKWALQTCSRSFIFYNGETKCLGISELHWIRVSVINK
jgi:hypothetical protein